MDSFSAHFCCQSEPPSPVFSTCSSAACETGQVWERETPDASGALPRALHLKWASWDLEGSNSCGLLGGLPACNTFSGANNLEAGPVCSPAGAAPPESQMAPGQRRRALVRVDVTPRRAGAFRRAPAQRACARSPRPRVLHHRGRARGRMDAERRQAVPSGRGCLLRAAGTRRDGAGPSPSEGRPR